MKKIKIKLNKKTHLYFSREKKRKRKKTKKKFTRVQPLCHHVYAPYYLKKININIYKRIKSHQNQLVN